MGQQLCREFHSRFQIFLLHNHHSPDDSFARSQKKNGINRIHVLSNCFTIASAGVGCNLENLS
jgi:hypothetical protein